MNKTVLTELIEWIESETYMENEVVRRIPHPDKIKEKAQSLIPKEKEDAKQEAIGFAEWKDWYYINYKMKDGLYYAKTDLLKHINEATVYTTEQLYAIYQNSKNQNP